MESSRIVPIADLCPQCKLQEVHAYWMGEYWWVRCAASAHQGEGSCDWEDPVQYPNDQTLKAAYSLISL